MSYILFLQRKVTKLKDEKEVHTQEEDISKDLETASQETTDANKAEELYGIERNAFLGIYSGGGPLSVPGGSKFMPKSGSDGGQNNKTEEPGDR